MMYMCLCVWRAECVARVRAPLLWETSKSTLCRALGFPRTETIVRTSAARLYIVYMYVYMRMHVCTCTLGDRVSKCVCVWGIETQKRIVYEFYIFPRSTEHRHTHTLSYRAYSVRDDDVNVRAHVCVRNCVHLCVPCV